MSLFSRKKSENAFPPFDLDEWAPAVRSSICTGERTAGMKNRFTGKFREIMLIRTEADLEEFCRAYGVSLSSVETIY